jgi:hypothetical protein
MVVLLAALGSGFHFEGCDLGSHLAAEHQVESIRRAGRKTGKQYLQGCGVYSLRGGVIHGQYVFANTHVNAHIATVYSTDREISTHTAPFRARDGLGCIQGTAAYRAIRYISQLSAIADPTKRTKQ